MMETDVNEEEEILFMNALYLKADGEVLIKSMWEDLCLSVVVDDEILIVWDQN